MEEKGENPELEKLDPELELQGKKKLNLKKTTKTKF